jgi:hypothetical protein
MRRAAKRDANQPEIVAALRKVGVFVVDLAGVADGIPDIMCGWHGSWKLLEIKDGTRIPSQRQLKPKQVIFHADCAERGLPCYVVKSVDEALSLFRR